VNEPSRKQKYQQRIPKFEITRIERTKSTRHQEKVPSVVRRSKSDVSEKRNFDLAERDIIELPIKNYQLNAAPSAAVEREFTSNAPLLIRTATGSDINSDTDYLDISQINDNYLGKHDAEISMLEIKGVFDDSVSHTTSYNTKSNGNKLKQKVVDDEIDLTRQNDVMDEVVTRHELSSNQYNVCSLEESDAMTSGDQPHIQTSTSSGHSKAELCTPPSSVQSELVLQSILHYTKLTQSGSYSETEPTNQPCPKSMLMSNEYPSDRVIKLPDTADKQENIRKNNVISCDRNPKMERSKHDIQKSSLSRASTVSLNDILDNLVPSDDEQETEHRQNNKSKIAAETENTTTRSRASEIDKRVTRVGDINDDIMTRIEGDDGLDNVRTDGDKMDKIKEKIPCLETCEIPSRIACADDSETMNKNEPVSINEDVCEGACVGGSEAGTVAGFIVGSYEVDLHNNTSADESDYLGEEIQRLMKTFSNDLLRSSDALNVSPASDCCGRSTSTTSEMTEMSKNGNLGVLLKKYTINTSGHTRDCDVADQNVSDERKDTYENLLLPQIRVVESVTTSEELSDVTNESSLSDDVGDYFTRNLNDTTDSCCTSDVNTVRRVYQTDIRTNNSTLGNLTKSSNIPYIKDLQNKSCGSSTRSDAIRASRANEVRVSSYSERMYNETQDLPRNCSELPPNCCEFPRNCSECPTVDVPGVERVTSASNVVSVALAAGLRQTSDNGYSTSRASPPSICELTPNLTRRNILIRDTALRNERAFVIENISKESCSKYSMVHDYEQECSGANLHAADSAADALAILQAADPATAFATANIDAADPAAVATASINETKRIAGRYQMSKSLDIWEKKNSTEMSKEMVRALTSYFEEIRADQCSPPTFAEYLNRKNFSELEDVQDESLRAMVIPEQYCGRDEDFIRDCQISDTGNGAENHNIENDVKYEDQGNCVTSQSREFGYVTHTNNVTLKDMENYVTRDVENPSRAEHVNIWDSTKDTRNYEIEQSMETYLTFERAKSYISNTRNQITNKVELDKGKVAVSEVASSSGTLEDEEWTEMNEGDKMSEYEFLEDAEREDLSTLDMDNSCLTSEDDCSGFEYQEEDGQCFKIEQKDMKSMNNESRLDTLLFESNDRVYNLVGDVVYKPSELSDLDSCSPLGDGGMMLDREKSHSTSMPNVPFVSGNFLDNVSYVKACSLKSFVDMNLWPSYPSMVPTIKRKPVERISKTVSPQNLSSTVTCGPDSPIGCQSVQLCRQESLSPLPSRDISDLHNDTLYSHSVHASVERDTDLLCRLSDQVSPHQTDDYNSQCDISHDQSGIPCDQTRHHPCDPPVHLRSDRPEMISTTNVVSPGGESEFRFEAFEEVLENICNDVDLMAATRAAEISRQKSQSSDLSGGETVSNLL